MTINNYETIKNEKDLKTKAKMLAEELFMDKTDKGGLPYMNHLETVSKRVKNKNQKIIALLHDTIEDIGIKEKELLDLGFDKKIVDAVVILSRKQKPKEDYNEYIERIINSNNLDAMEVKLADLSHNMEITRIENPTIKDFDRIEKRYRPNYIKIQTKVNEMRK